MNEFVEIFGDFTVGYVVSFITACIFMVTMYNKTKKYFLEKYDSEQQKNGQIEEMLTEIKEFTEYRRESMKMQGIINEQIQELKAMHQNNTKRLEKIEEENKQRECNRLRDILLQNYRYYTSREPQSWSRMEHDTFFEIYNDYTNLGGNSYMHSVVGPAMEKLTITEIDLHK